MSDDPKITQDGNVISVGKEWGGGLYNIVLGDGGELSRGVLLAAMLGLNINDFARYRDAWIENLNGPVIRFYTRLGGGNREGYKDTIRMLQTHPNYLKDEDDTYDSTYASFYFTPPQKFHETCAKAMREPLNMDLEWKQALTAISEINEMASTAVNKAAGCTVHKDELSERLEKRE